MKAKTKRNSVAVTNLLDEIKAEGIVPVNEEDVRKNKELEKKYVIKEISPDKCVLWDMANRFETYINSQTCEELIESIKKTGQQIPVIVRPHTKKPKMFELICGSRRLFACKSLGINILVAITNLTDKEALLAMDAENRARTDISPYERAIDYKNWVQKNVYKNYAEIIKATGMKKSWFSQLISLAELEPSIVQAFKSPHNLKIKWGYELHKICEKSKASKETIISTAKKLSSKELSSQQIFNKLKSCSIETKSNNKPENISRWVIKDNGEKVFKLTEHSSGNITVLFPRKIGKENIYGYINQLEEKVKSLLE